MNRVMMDDSLPMLVFEIGLNHNGHLILAMDMISEIMCIVDKYEYPRELIFFKFQKRNPRTEVPKHEWGKTRLSPFSQMEMSYIEYKEEVELWESDYVAIDKILKNRYEGARWFVSVWGPESLLWLESNFPDQQFVKIPSALASDFNFVHDVMSSFFPNVIISTGGLTKDEINSAVMTARKFEKTGENLFLLACTSTYPTEIHEVGLNRIQSYKYHWQHEATIGYSSHSTSVLVPVLASAIGAGMIEFHVTLDRAMIGSDHAASMEMPGVDRIVRDIVATTIIGGNGKIGPYESELEKLETLKHG